MNIKSNQIRKRSETTIAQFDEKGFAIDWKFKVAICFRDSLDIKPGGPLRIEGSLVECNPGSRAARYLVGMGAGKAAVAGVIEVFEPGKKRPSLRLYARDTASAGGFGGDSVSMMNHIINVLAVRMTSVLEGRIDIR